MDLNQGSVLVVDDNEDNRVVLKRRLERRGLQVSLAENGRKALDLLNTEKFDLVLLDIMMPVMNGYQVLEEMNGDSKLRHIPVIVISGLDDMESIVKCIELGAEDYLLKPFNSTLLKARINASLEKKHLRDKEDYYLQQIQEYNAQLEKRVQEHLQELKMARRVQTSLLPSDTPKMKEWEFAVLWIPAREIAGDYYDFVPEASGGMNLVIGDVTDKGLPASLFMVFARNSVRRGIAGARLPSEVMSQANRSICTESTNGLYITLVYALLEASGGKLTYVNAGHNSPLLYWVQKKELVELSATGMPLGVDVNATYLEQSVTMEAGDCLVLYTDGVVDALNSEKEAFGIDRLRKIVVCNEGESAENIIKAIETSLRRHVGSATWYDDVTIVVVKKL